MKEKLYNFERKRSNLEFDYENIFQGQAVISKSTHNREKCFIQNLYGLKEVK